MAPIALVAFPLARGCEYSVSTVIAIRNSGIKPSCYQMHWGDFHD